MRKLTSLALPLALAACGGAQSAPVTVSNTAPSAAPAADDAVYFELDGRPWRIKAAATHTQPEKYTHRFATAGWTIEVGNWPKSEVFVQTLEEQLAADRERDPNVVVLHQETVGADNWALVDESQGKISGVVLLPGTGDNAMCTFDLPSGSPWQASLDACRLIAQDEGNAMGDGMHDDAAME